MERTQVVIAGAGLAGIVTALDLLDSGRKIIMLERSPSFRLGGLARDSFGGIFIAGSPEQKRLGIPDSADQALKDWLATACFEKSDEWPRRWAELYTAASRSSVYDYLQGHGIRFFPFVHWVERGLFGPGNTYPRFHMVWGTGKRLVDRLLERLESHPARKNLEIRFLHKVTGLLSSHGRITGCNGVIEGNAEKNSAFEAGGDFQIQADHVVLASGGIGGSLEKVREFWGQGNPPATILNGSYPTADGLLHDVAASAGARITHLNRMWNYAAGVRHPRPLFENHGLSLVPPKTALWVNARGQRIGPLPLITAYDTKYLVDRICEEPGGYSWQILNRKIALKELAVSGSEFNDAIRDRRIFAFLWTLLRGNKKLVDDLCAHCPDFIVASSVPELVEKMNRTDSTSPLRVDGELLKQEIEKYDRAILTKGSFQNDEQLRRIQHLRRYRGDRLRTLKKQPIVARDALPLIAIRESILSRKSLGGIQTNLDCAVLDRSGQPIAGLLAVGEAAGFGGGGIHGKAALEGTFLGGCILTGRRAAAAITGRTIS
ncbi:MAG: FAD-binding dehydrogenase [Spirochaetales bacterium]|nr:FAD-binding dehydrogenase [Spirochaetales bacterium]